MSERFTIYRCPACGRTLASEDACCCEEGIFNFGEPVEVVPAADLLSLEEQLAKAVKEFERRSRAALRASKELDAAISGTRERREGVAVAYENAAKHLAALPGPEEQ